SMAGLMLLTAGYENIGGKISFGARVAQTKTTPQDVGEKNIYPQWQGGSSPNLYEGGFFIRGDFLYWRADEEGLEYATVSNIEHSTQAITSRLNSQAVTWSPGFRIGVGYTFSSQDYWDLAALWTHFQTHQTASNSFNVDLQASGPVIVPGWGATILGSYANQASVDWNLMYNIYDLDVGRNYFISKTISIHPFVGVRGATIHQKYHAKYNALINMAVVPSIPTSFRATTHFWGIGAHIGTGLQWYIHSSFSFLGNVGGSLLYGDFKIQEKYNGLVFFDPSNPSTNLLALKDHDTTGAVNLEAMLGFQWEKFFYQNRYRLSITAGYEWSEWFSQNRMAKADTVNSQPAGVIAGATSFDHEDGNLMLQGAKLQVGWDF
ncbi:MAG: Lpg1974 family pore-forming outer membrane protein, partial [Rhabdochlamydiaceae bacterium]